MVKQLLILMFCFFFVPGKPAQAQELTAKKLRLVFIDDITYRNCTIYGFMYSEDTSLYFIAHRQNVELSKPAEKLIPGEFYTLKYYRLCGPVKLIEQSPMRSICSISYLRGDPKKELIEIFYSSGTVVAPLYFSPNLFGDYYVPDKE